MSPLTTRSDYGGSILTRCHRVKGGSVMPLGTGFKVKVMLRQTINRQSVLVSGAHLGSMTRYLLLSVAGLLMWGALSDDRTGF
jgi:thiamine transporter ThiT